MIAVDTSSMIAFLEGAAGDDVDMVQSALEHQALLAGLPLLDIEPGYWERAGRLRASVLKQRRKARMADALIAQSCLDQFVPLVTRDKDFRHFARGAGLTLV